MENTLDEKGWEILLRRIENGNCTPFLGAGACYGAIQMGAEIAEEWAQKYGYPLENKKDLAAVSQYIAVQYDPITPKEELQAKFRTVVCPAFRDPDEPHGLLAELPLPIYITTNYDDFMLKALESREKKPKYELCRWNKLLKDKKSILETRRDYTPSPEEPLVFYLHGHISDVRSLVLTEDDYLDFLVNMAGDDRLIPSRIQRAVAETSLLFLGYSIADWDFRVLFRSIAKLVERSNSPAHVSVQLEPVGKEAGQEAKKNARDYLDRYFQNQKIRVYWGKCRDFATELRQRWDAYPKARFHQVAK